MTIPSIELNNDQTASFKVILSIKTDDPKAAQDIAMGYCWALRDIKHETVDLAEELLEEVRK